MRDKIRKILKESYYDSDKLYSKFYIERVLSNAPFSIKKYLNQLEEIDCMDGNGKPYKCVRISQVIYVYLQGKY